MNRNATKTVVDDLVAFLRCDDTKRSLADAERIGRIPEEMRRDLARCGLFGLSVPISHGGLGIGLRERARLHRQLGAVSASLQSVVTVHEMSVHAISAHAAPDVARRWLEPMAEGGCLGAFALTEPAGGSSVEQLRASARHRTGGYVLDGTKSWVSGALTAGVCVTIVRSGDWVRVMLVDRERPGLLISPSQSLVAFCAAGVGDLSFADCEVGADAAIGPEGFGGLRLVTSCLTLGRILIAAGALGVGSAALNLLVEHASRRSVGHGILASQPLAQAAASEAYLSLCAGIALISPAASAFEERDTSVGRRAIAAKLVAARAAREATSTAVALHGAAGLAVGSLLQRFAAEAQVYGLIEGSAEVLSLTLGADLMSSGTDFETL